MIAVSLFDYTGNMLKPWLEAGYSCHLFDRQHPEGMTRREDGMYLHGMDLANSPAGHITWLMDNGAGEAAFLSCFPPCTHLAVSGARWFKGKGLRALEESIGLFASCTEVAAGMACPYIIENPVSTISTYWRKPDYTFHPYDFAGFCEGDNYTKKTCLWTGGGFVMPPRNPGNLEPDDRIHKAAPSPERAAFRSATPVGFAKAVFESNHKIEAVA